MKRIYMRIPLIPRTRSAVLWALLALMAPAPAAPLGAQETSPPAGTRGERETGGAEGRTGAEGGDRVDLGPGHSDVRSLELLVAGGGRVAWSAQGDRIAYDRRGEDGLYDLYVAEADGEGERCVTCDVYELRKAHSFHPAWAPSAEWLVFQVQDVARKLKMGVVELATPLRSAHSELWAVPVEGRRAWQLTRQGRRGGSPTDPHFAHEGGRILWSERVGAEPKPWGDWVVRVAEIAFKRGTPRLGKVRTHEPARPRGLALAQGFSPDDRGFLYGVGSLESGLRLGRFPLGGGDQGPEPLFQDVSLAGEALRPVPGRQAWTLATDLGTVPDRERRGLPRVRDLWIVEGESRERLTYFNHPDFRHPALGPEGKVPGDPPQALIDDVAWSPAGDRLLLHVVRTDPGAPEGVREDVWLLVLDASYRR